jgi:hypothetical protein
MRLMFYITGVGMQLSRFDSSTQRARYVLHNTITKQEGALQMTDKKTCEIFIAMNEDGDYVVCTDESEAL